MMFKSATTRLLQMGTKKSPEEEYLDRVRENITYEQLIERTMKAQREAQTAIDQTLPALQRAMKRRQRTRLAIQGELDVLAAASEEHLDDGIALYHAAIRPSQPQTTTIDRAPLALTSNRNCSLDIYHMPAGTTTAMVLDAIAKFRPVGEIYDAHLTQIQVDHNGNPKHDSLFNHLRIADTNPSQTSEDYYKHVKHICVARIRFKAAHSAARLFQIGNKPGLGLYIRGVKVVVTFTASPRPSMGNEDGTRVVILRGPREIVALENLRRIWSDKFFHANTQRVIVGSVDAQGIREVEWRFNSFWWCAEVAHSLFRCEYRNRTDCEVRFGKDPCA